MAIIKCPECNGKVSTEADACPNCGYKITKEDKQKALETTKTLIECPECQGEVSTTVDVCPSCGYKITEVEKQNAPKPKKWYAYLWEIAFFCVTAYTLSKYLGKATLPILAMMTFLIKHRNK